MDSLITAAARALAAGDPLGALQRVALRDDPPGLALRGIAMAQLGELPRARELLRQAARGFGAHEALARARASCLVAEAEVALALRDLQAPLRPLSEAAATLEARGDRANALHARLVDTRRLLLLGRLGEAATALQAIDPSGLPPALAAVAGLAEAELALRSLRISPARNACCASTKSRRSRDPEPWSSTPAASGCGPAPTGGRWPAGCCCSRWRTRWPRPGRATSTGRG
jgi:hypothetical protein